MKLLLPDKLEKPEGFTIISQSWFTTSTYGRSILRGGRFTPAKTGQRERSVQMLYQGKVRLLDASV